MDKERITLSTFGGGISNPVFDPEIIADTNGNPVIILTVGDTDPSDPDNDDLPAGGHILQFSRLAGIVNSVSPSASWVSMSDDGITYGQAFTLGE